MKKKLFSEIPFIRGERLTIKAVKEEDADSLQEMIDNPNVYKYEPSFLFEKRYDDQDNKKPQKPLNFRGFSTSMRLDLNQRPLRPEESLLSVSRHYAHFLCVIWCQLGCLIVQKRQ